MNAGLHTEDDEVATQAVALLDDIEADRQGEDVVLQEVIADKETSIAYVVNFANKVFANAKLQIQDQKSSKSTAMGLMASVNFYDLVKLWPEEQERLEETEELSKKVKYAKYHAARILKSIKNGEDPNEYVVEAEIVVSNDDLVPESVDPLEADVEQPTITEDKEIDEEQDNEPSLALPSAPSSKPPQSLDDLGLPSTPSSNPGAFSLPEPPREEPKPVKPTPQRKLVKEVNVTEIMESSEVYTKAQRHAKFAISAMNYEDKDTAIKELEEAIKALGQL